MFKTVRGRIIAIVLVCLAAGWQIKSNGIKLGLDLQGGMHLVLEIDDPQQTLTPEARAEAIENAARVLRSRIDQYGVEEPLIQASGGDRVIVELAGLEDKDRARNLIQQAAFLEFKIVRPVTQVESQLSRMDRAALTEFGPDSLAALGHLGDEGGLESANAFESALFGGGVDTTEAADSTAAEPADSAAAAGSDEADAELESRPFTSLLKRDISPTAGTDAGSFLVEEADYEVAQILLGNPRVLAGLPRNITLQWGEEVVASAGRTYRRLYVLEEDAFVTGVNLNDAIASRDMQANAPLVQFELDRAGGAAFGRATGSNIGGALAIVLDGRVVSAPTVQSRITTRGQIEMGTGSSMEEAADLALVLRAGALPAPLRIMDDREVGPSLGADSIDQGQLAGILGLVLVLLIMIAYYRVAGVLAIGALGIYVLLVLGGLAGFGANLTLPGIAGLILSVGMAVDANVLIFERIREELLAGRATRTAVDEGFGNAFSAILDANITSLITALILFQFGTGPVQGFAVTLSIGIVASFFSALFVTRTFFLLYLQGKKASDPISI